MVVPPNCRSLRNGRALSPHERIVLALHGPVPRLRQAGDLARSIPKRPDPLAEARLERRAHRPDVLRDLGCDLATREEIARLVRFHGRPPYLLEKPIPSTRSISLSWLVSNKLLYLFALADTRGRTTARDDTPGRDAAPLEARRRGVRLLRRRRTPSPTITPGSSSTDGQARPASLHPARGLSLHGDAHVGAAGERQGHVAGAQSAQPAGGLARRSSGRTRRRRHRRSGRSRPLAQERCRELLRSRQDFAFNATNLLRQTRRRWIDLFADYGARIETVYVEPPLPVILERNRQRERKVPEDVILRLAGKMEPATWTETHTLQLIE